MRKLNVIGVGEVLWDMLPSGRQLGGACANFACHAQALGAAAGLISRVGRDSAGCDIVRRLEAWRLPLSLIQTDEVAPTGLVSVKLDVAGQPEFTIHEPSAWDFLEPTAAALEAAQAADVICFGSLAQRHERSRLAVQTLVGASPCGALRVFDINLRQQFYSKDVIVRSLELANVLKLNDAELPVLAQLLGLKASPEDAVAQLASRFELQLVALTCGAAGSALFQDGRWSRCGSKPVEVRDTVGAGDAFTAALTVGLRLGMELNEVHSLATEIAGFVCSQSGATPALPRALVQRFMTDEDRGTPGKEGMP